MLSTSNLSPMRDLSMERGARSPRRASRRQSHANSPLRDSAQANKGNEMYVKKAVKSLFGAKNQTQSQKQANERGTRAADGGRSGDAKTAAVVAAAAQTDHSLARANDSFSEIDIHNCIDTNDWSSMMVHFMHLIKNDAIHWLDYLQSMPLPDASRDAGKEAPLAALAAAVDDVRRRCEQRTVAVEGIATEIRSKFVKKQQSLLEMNEYLQEKCEQLEIEKESYESIAEAANERFALRSSEIEDAKRAAAAAAKGAGGAQHIIDDLRTQLRNVQQSLSKTQDERDAAQRENSSLHARLREQASKTKQTEETTEEITALRTENVQLKESIESLKKECSECNSKCDEAVQTQEKLQSELEIVNKLREEDRIDALHRSQAERTAKINLRREIEALKVASRDEKRRLHSHLAAFVAERRTGHRRAQLVEQRVSSLQSALKKQNEEKEEETNEYGSVDEIALLDAQLASVDAELAARDTIDTLSASFAIESQTSQTENEETSAFFFSHEEDLQLLDAIRSVEFSIDDIVSEQEADFEKLENFVSSQAESHNFSNLISESCLLVRVDDAAAAWQSGESRCAEISALFESERSMHSMRLKQMQLQMQKARQANDSLFNSLR